MKVFLSRIANASENALAWSVTTLSILMFLVMIWAVSRSSQANAPQPPTNPALRENFQRQIWLEARIKVCAGKTQPTPACKTEDIKNILNYRKELAELRSRSR